MSTNTPPTRDIKTRGYVLRRTNYGESDRILNLITPEGKFAVIAKSVRKPRSKLAGGTELFTLSEFNIHLGRSELGVLTGAKMIRHHGNIVQDFAKIELAALILKRVTSASEHSDNPEYFKLIDSTFSALQRSAPLELIETWFLLNLVRATGEEINLYRDTNGAPLQATATYTWDVTESAFANSATGQYHANEIKFLRLMLSSDLPVVQRVKLTPDLLTSSLRLARILAKI